MIRAYISSNLAFLIDIYNLSRKNKNKKIYLFERNSNLGGAWSVNNCRIHLEWESPNLVNKRLDIMQKNLKDIDNKFYIMKNKYKTITINNILYTDYELLSIRPSTNDLLEFLVSKIKKNKNIKIINTDIKNIEYVSKNNIIISDNKNKWTVNELFLTNMVQLDYYKINKVFIHQKYIKKNYYHILIKITSNDFYVFDTLIANGPGIQGKLNKNSVFYKKLNIDDKNTVDVLSNQLKFLTNESYMFDECKNTFYFTCRISDIKNIDLFISSLKKFLILIKIYKNIKIEVIQTDTYTQYENLQKKHNFPKDIHYLSSNNFYYYLHELLKINKNVN